MEALIDKDLRLERAKISLEGLSVGDAFGEHFFGPLDVAQARIKERQAPPRPWRYTDDTVMAECIVETLEEFGGADQDTLARRFGRRYTADPNRGYGQTAHRILAAIAAGEDWPDAAASAFDGMGSMGNGGAMRAAPIGAYFSEDPKAAAFHAQRAAEVTHAHIEGQAGAMAVAVAAAYVCGKHGPLEDLLYAVSGYIPDSETKGGILRARELGPDASVSDAADILGNGSLVLAQDTVPFTLWCAQRFAGDYENALWQTVSGFGDCDTNCAIVGGIVVFAQGIDGIPSEWRNAREPLSVPAVS